MKIVFISSMLPSGHYSQVICSGLSKKLDLVVYSDNQKENLKIQNCGTVKAVWRKSPHFIFDILTHLSKDKPDLVHFQHELNMFGGQATAVLFPIALLLVKVLGYKTAVTFHGTVAKKDINQKFLYLFHQDKKYMTPTIIRLFFNYIFKVTSLFCDQIFVHTKMAKNILVNDYQIDSKKISNIPIPIPKEKVLKKKQKKYFFYFGYMVRRKGLDYIINGFSDFVKKSPKTPFQLILAGGVIKGQEKALEEVRNLIKKKKLDKKIKIVGFINQKQQDDLYNNAYCTLIPAVITVGSSGPLFHSDSYYKCVIASNIGFFKEDVKHKRTGILTENHKWSFWLDYLAKHPKIVSEIEQNVKHKAITRSPGSIALLYKKTYEKITHK